MPWSKVLYGVPWERKEEETEREKARESEKKVEI